MSKNQKIKTLRISEQLFQLLVERAKANHRSVNAEIVHVLSLYLKETVNGN